MAGDGSPFSHENHERKRERERGSGEISKLLVVVGIWRGGRISFHDAWKELLMAAGDLSV